MGSKRAESQNLPGYIDNILCPLLCKVVATCEAGTRCEFEGEKVDQREREARSEDLMRLRLTECGR